jgi:tRNA pseudouridine55 synthase
VNGNGKPGAWPSGLVIVDKPAGITSHDVVARVRRLARTRRVGHAGTLDPMATGVLILGIEKATRLLGHLMLTQKTYAATIRLGQSTTTDDAEGEALPARGDAPVAADIPRARLETEIAKLTGEILQVPSSVSAIKVNGQRAYKLTRAGEAPELAARPVTVYEFGVTAIREEGDFLAIDAVIRCSSGTYIRALARDLGNALGTGGHLTALRRTAVGPYTLAKAHTLKDLENQGQDENQSPERVRLTADPHTAPQPPEDAVARPVPDQCITLQAASATGAGLAAAAIPNGPSASGTGGNAAAPVVIPLAAAAAAAFPRLDLTADDARRLAQGARLPLSPDQLRIERPPLPPAMPGPPGPPGPVAPGIVAGSDQPIGAVGHNASRDVMRRPSGQRPSADMPPEAADLAGPDVPLAAFDPDGTLIALVTVEEGRLRSLAVFVDAAAKIRELSREAPLGSQASQADGPAACSLHGCASGVAIATPNAHPRSFKVGSRCGCPVSAAYQSPMKRRIRTQLSRTGPQFRRAAAAL